MPRLSVAGAQVRLRPDGGLRLGVVADTHSSPNPRGLGHLKALELDHLLHAGDVGDLGVLSTLSALAPLTAVRGNIDVRAPSLPDVVTVDLLDGDDRLALRILLLHIALNGPRLRPDVARRARAAKASLVVCGHSHVPFIGRDGELTVFNPGSIGPRRFTLPILFGVIEVTKTGVSLAHLDAESGRPWAPG